MLRTVLSALVAVSMLMGAMGASASTSDNKTKTTALGNPDAPKKGTFYYNLELEPATLNPITSTDVYAQILHGYVTDTLMARNEDSFEWQPMLAEKAEQSPDGKTITFVIRKDAKFHDGKPVTAEDIKFSFDVIRDPTYNAAHQIPYYENIEKAEVKDPHTIVFTTKSKYFGNFNVLASLTVVPKHVYGDPKKGSKMNKQITGSGPYKIGRYDQGKRIQLERNKDWWGNQVPELKTKYNFERIVMRFAKESNIAMEMLKKGDLDFVSMTPEMFEKKAVGPEWGKKVHKKKVENKAAVSYGYIGWNLTKDLFKDRNVRVALAHLMNRELMNEKFRFGMSHLATGPWYQQSDYADKSVKPLLYDPKKAADLLKKAGWADSDKDGTLDKVINGKKTNFAFTLVYGNPDTEKYWTLYQQDLKKAGIRMDLKMLEWNALLKFLDDRNFDAVAMGWGGVVELDPKQIWHSASQNTGGSNRIGYSNPKVDKLIDQAREELDRTKRIKLLQQVYRMVAEDAPYLFLFNDKYTLYGHTERMGMEKPTYGYAIGLDYWWETK